MRKRLLVLSVASLFALCGTAANLHWQGVSGSGVGNFELPTNWLEGSVPGEGDFVIVKDYYAANWAVTLNSDVTNWKAELGAPLVNYELLFKLNGHVWTFTNNLHMHLGYGGGMTFTNGTIRTPLFSFIPQSGVVGVTTNMVLSVKDVACEVGATEISATRATFMGGSLRVTNSLTVGTVGYGVGTVFLDKGVRCGVSNALYVGDAAGATGELVNVNGQFEQTGTNGLFMIGSSGCGSLTLQGGSTFMNSTPYFGFNNTGVGLLTVSGGSNTFSKVPEFLLQVGSSGKGTILAYGGTNYASGLSLGWGNSGYGEMLLTNGVWTFSNYSWIGYYGRAVVTISGGRLYSGSAFCIGRGTGTGVVTVAGGTLEVPGEVRLGGNPTSQGRLTLTGNGILKAGYIAEYSAGASSVLLFDGGTLQAGASGALIRSVDDIRLTTNGLVLDTAGYNVTITGLLQNAVGEAGSLTKKGAGTLTLASDHAANGPVKVLGGTLKPDTGKAIVLSGGASVAGGAVLDVSLASGTDYTTVSGSVSRIDGTLTLKAGGRLVVGTGASLAGTGTVARVTLQDNAVLARAKADNAVTPLTVSDCVANGQVIVALTGYTLGELKTAVPLIRMPTAAIDAGKVTVTLNGQPNPFLFVKYVSDGGQQVLSVSYSVGTLIRLY